MINFQNGEVVSKSRFLLSDVSSFAKLELGVAEERLFGDMVNSVGKPSNGWEKIRGSGEVDRARHPYPRAGERPFLEENSIRIPALLSSRGAEKKSNWVTRSRACWSADLGITLEVTHGNFNCYCTLLM